MKQIVMFTGSTSSRSINYELLRPVLTAMPEYSIRVLELRDLDIPVYSEILEAANGIPDPISRLYAEFSRADAFVFSTPEHNGLMPAFLKNIFDWLSRINQKIFFYKPVFVLSTSPGKNGGKSGLDILTRLLPRWGADCVFSYSLGSFHDNFDADAGDLSNDEEKRILRQTIQQFKGVLTFPKEAKACTHVK